MEFNNVTNTALGLCQDVDFLCGTTTASYPLADKVRNINHAYRDVNRMIWDCSDAWQYDDSNNTDIPKAFTLLVNGTHEYAIPTTSQRVRRVEVKNANGQYEKLRMIDYRDIGTAIPEHLSADGMPICYDLVGQYIRLYPGPATNYVTMASGMAVYMDRDVTNFTTASTTTEPGFAPSFHRILSLQAAIDFEKDVNQRHLFVAEKNRLEDGLRRFYNSRAVEARSEIKPFTKKHHRQYE